MESRVQMFEVPQSNARFYVQVFEDGSWLAYSVINGEPDYANPIGNLNYIPEKIRSGVRLYIDKCTANFAAIRVS